MLVSQVSWLPAFYWRRLPIPIGTVASVPRSLPVTVAGAAPDSHRLPLQPTSEPTPTTEDFSLSRRLCAYLT